MIISLSPISILFEYYHFWISSLSPLANLFTFSFKKKLILGKYPTNYLLMSYFSASGKALLPGPNILLGGRTDISMDVCPAT